MFNPIKHQRRSLRLPGYDYASMGWYFVTICTYKKEILFGNVVDKKMVLNQIGKIID